MGSIINVDNARAPKNGWYLMYIFFRDGKWTLQFGDIMFDTSTAKCYDIYERFKAQII